MNLLALDTATEALSVSLAMGDRQIDRYVEMDRGHSEQVLPMIQEVLAEGADAVCYKPFDVPGLLQTLEQLAQPKNMTR